MQARTLKLVAMSVVGNAYADRHVWEESWTIASDTTAPMDDRLVAMAKMNELTGVDDPCTPEELENLLDWTDDARITPAKIGLVLTDDVANLHTDIVIRS